MVGVGVEFVFFVIDYVGYIGWVVIGGDVLVVGVVVVLVIGIDYCIGVLC